MNLSHALLPPKEYTVNASESVVILGLNQGQKTNAKGIKRIGGVILSDNPGTLTVRQGLKPDGEWASVQNLVLPDSESKGVGAFDSGLGSLWSNEIPCSTFEVEFTDGGSGSTFSIEVNGVPYD